MFWNKDKELIEFVEKEAGKLDKFQIECLLALEKARDILMNILLGGAGGSLALSISLFEKNAESWIFIGTFCTSLFLFALFGVMVTGIGKNDHVMPLGNEPNNLYNENYKDMDMVDFRLLYLGTRQAAIDERRKYNDEFGAWLDKIRYFAAFTPFIIIFSYLVSLLNY